MNKKTLPPDEIMKLYPMEEINKMSGDQTQIILKNFMASLIEHSENKEGTAKEITDVLDKCINKTKKEILKHYKDKGENNNE